MTNHADAANDTAPKFSKEQLFRSARYRKRRDLIGAILQNGGEYTLEEVDAKIENYMKGKVK